MTRRPITGLSASSCLNYSLEGESNYTHDFFSIFYFLLFDNCVDAKSVIHSIILQHNIAHIHRLSQLDLVTDDSFLRLFTSKPEASNRLWTSVDLLNVACSFGVARMQYSNTASV